MYMTAGLFIISCLVVGVPAPAGHGGTALCRSCPDKYVMNASDCTVFEKCPHHQSCGVDIHELNNEYYFNYKCMDHHMCEDTRPQVVGKRAPGHHDHGDAICWECCPSGTTCPQTKCQQYISQTANNDCQDYESDTFQCSELDQYNFCTDTASVSHHIALTKCRKHCGLCGTPVATDVPMTNAPMTDAPMSNAPMTDAPMTATTTGAAMTPAIVNINITAGDN